MSNICGKLLNVYQFVSYFSMPCKLVFFYLCSGSYIKYVHYQQLQQSTSQENKKNPSISTDDKPVILAVYQQY
jgi:hypothetical protein